MRRLVLALVLLSSLSAKAQVVDAKRVRVTENFRVPLDTLVNPAYLFEWRWRDADSSIYVARSLTGGKWWKMTTGSGGGGGGSFASYRSANFSPTSTINTDFVVFASAIVSASNSYSNGSNIVYQFIEDADHATSFFDTAYGNVSTSRMVVRYPRAKRVMNFTVTPDEAYTANGVLLGPSVGDSITEINATQPAAIGITLTGNGTGTWVATGGTFFFDLSAFNTSDGGTGFTIFRGYYLLDYAKVSVTYQGSNAYRVKRVYTGLGGYSAKFVLTDAFGNPVTDNPTSSDQIVITSGAMSADQTNLAVYDTKNSFIGNGGLANTWNVGLFECWMVAEPTGSTSARVRYQLDFSSATTYKIYRSTSKYGTYTLVHTGSSGTFNDTGLTPGTTYFYKEYAVIVGVDNYVTSFKVKTPS